MKIDTPYSLNCVAFASKLLQILSVFGQLPVDGMQLVMKSRQQLMDSTRTSDTFQPTTWYFYTHFRDCTVNMQMLRCMENETAGANRNICRQRAALYCLRLVKEYDTSMDIPAGQGSSLAWVYLLHVQVMANTSPFRLPRGVLHLT